MDERIVSLEDMAFAEMVDARLQNILSGHQPGDNPLDEDLSALITQMNELVPEPHIPTEMTDAHIAGILDTFAGLGPSTVTAPQPRRTLAARLGSLAATPARKIAAASLALSTSFSGLAYAGALPDPIQRKAADLAQIVGIDLPHPDDPVIEDSGPAETDVPATGSDGDQPTLDGQGDLDDDTGGSAGGKDHGAGGDSSGKPNEDKDDDESSGGDDESGDDGDDSGSHGSGSDDDSDSEDDSDDHGSGSDSDEADDDSDEDSDDSGSGGSGSDSDSDADTDDKDSESDDDVELDDDSDEDAPDPDDAIDDGSDADDGADDSLAN